MILRGPLGFVSPKVAHHIERALHAEAVKAERGGYKLPRDVADFLGEVRALAEHYRRSASDVDVTANRANDASVTAPAVVPPPPTRMSVEEVASWVGDGITPSGVRAACRRGDLPADRIGRQYVIDETDARAWNAQRSKTA